MKKLIKRGWLVLMVLLVGWVNVQAQESQTAANPVELQLIDAEITVAQNEKIDPMSLVVSGSFDQLYLPIINTAKPGPVQITFIAQRDQEKVKVSKTILVRDGIGPVIEGDAELELRFNSDFDIVEAYSVTDNLDKEVTLEVIGEIDRQKAGEYAVTLKAVDSSHNETNKEIKVTVLEDPEVVALKARNQEAKELVTSAQALNMELLANVSVQEVESMLTQVNNLKDLESDYQAELTTLSSELTAKLARAQEYHKPVATPTTQTSSTPVATAPAPTDGAFNITMTRFGMDCVGCVVTNGVAYTSHGIGLSATAVQQPNGTWQEGITYNGRYLVAGNRDRVKCTLLTIYNHPYEGMGIVQGQPIYAVIGDNGAFGYNHIDLFVGTETFVDRVWIANPSAQPYAIITGFGTFTGSGCAF